MELVQVEHPKMLEKIENEDYRQWALELHQIWQQERINTPPVALFRIIPILSHSTAGQRYKQWCESEFGTLFLYDWVSILGTSTKRSTNQSLSLIVTLSPFKKLFEQRGGYD